MLKPQITIDDFAKIDLRVGKILDADVVPKSEKLLKLRVYFGEEIGTRQILAGIAKDYTPETLIHDDYVFCVNLAPRKLAGEVSEGMILCAAGDKPVVIIPAFDAKPGATIS